MDWSLVAQVVSASSLVLILVTLGIAIVMWLRRSSHMATTLRHLQDGNASLLEATVQRAEEARLLVAETHEDLVYATMPLLVLLDEPPVGIREQPWAAVRVRNVGNGPALNFVVWMHAGGNVYRSSGAEMNGFSGAHHLASGDTFEPGPRQTMLYAGKAKGLLDPGSAVVNEHPATNLVAYCCDSIGNRYQFNLRTGDPPAVWERGADAPPWAGAWDPRLSSAEPREQEGPEALRSLPERDASRLVTALRDALNAIEDGGAEETGIRLAGRAQDAARRSGFDSR